MAPEQCPPTNVLTTELKIYIKKKKGMNNT